jgi:hypothetical protein
MGSTLLIPLGLGPTIWADDLPHLPSMNHGEVFEGFSTRISLEKKKVFKEIINKVKD